MNQLLRAMVLTIFLMIPLQYSSAISNLPQGFGVETVASDLTLPTTADFTPDGRIFIGQKDGVVRVVSAAGDLLATPLITLPDVNDAEDRGLVGLAVDPNFSTNGYVYLAYTYEVDPSRPGGYTFDSTLPNCTSALDDWSDNDCYEIPKKTARVVRVTVSGNTAPQNTMTTILGGLQTTPQKPSCLDYPGANNCIATDAASHSVGGLRFGADGKLFVATGDGAGFSGAEEQAFRAQDLDHLSGKILRINTDGTGPSDNPFYNGNPDDNRSKVYAYGFRNPYRFNFDPATNDLYVGNVGWFQYEQINKVDPGDNAGWPCYEGGLPATNGYQDLAGCPLTAAQQADFDEPYYAYIHDAKGEGSITSGAFATSSTYPSYFRGKFLFGDLVFGTLSYFDTTKDVVQDRDVTIFGTASQEEPLFPVEFITGPDGLIYYINIASGQLNRIVYASLSPIPVIQQEYVFGVPRTLRFDATQSSAPTGGTLSYAWEFGDGSLGLGSTSTHTYAQSGEYTVRLTVTSSTGYSTTKTQQITVIPPLYDTDPQIVDSETIVPVGPQNIGNTLFVPIEIENVPGTGSDPFRVIMEVKDDTGENISLSEYPEILTIPEGESLSIEQPLFLSTIGTYDVSVTIRSTDYAKDFATLSNAFSIDVQSRSPVDNQLPVYRFYSQAYQSHFYTISQVEKESLEANDPNWNYEGVAYEAGKAEQDDLRPVYRFWSDIYRSHFYTVFPEEKESLEQNDPNWSYEGVGWYVVREDSTEPITAVYRFYSPTYQSHFYTASLAEKESLEVSDPNWIYEGVGWYIQK